MHIVFQPLGFLDSLDLASRHKAYPTHIIHTKYLVLTINILYFGVLDAYALHTPMCFKFCQVSIIEEYHEDLEMLQSNP